MAVSKKQEHKIRKVMREFKAGTLHSGGPEGQKVTDPKQAIAIAYSEARRAGRRGEEDSPLNTKMKGDNKSARMKRRKQMGDSTF